MLLLGVAEHLCRRFFDFREIGFFFAGKNCVPPDVFDHSTAFAHFDLHQPEHLTVEWVGFIGIHTSQQNINVKDLFGHIAAF